jgi:hypothetical protein
MCVLVVTDAYTPRRGHSPGARTAPVGYRTLVRRATGRVQSLATLTSVAA